MPDRRVQWHGGHPGRGLWELFAVKALVASGRLDTLAPVTHSSSPEDIMSKAKRFSFQEGQDHVVPVRVTRVQGLRSSSAASPQAHSPRRQRSRAAARTVAIQGSYS